MIKRPHLLVVLFFSALSAYGQTTLEDYFNLCLEFGAPAEVVQLFQPFRTYKAETNGTVSYVAREDESLLLDTPYSEYQIWYTIDQTEGLYQTSLIVRGERTALQNILTSYLRRFSEMFGEPVYTNLNNGSLLIFWYDEEDYIVRARLILDIVNSYRYVSITHCSPLARHGRLLTTLYNGTVNGEEETALSSIGNIEEALPGVLEDYPEPQSDE